VLVQLRQRDSPATRAVCHAAGSTVTGPQRGDRQALVREGIVSLEALTESWGLCPRDLNPHVSEGGLHQKTHGF